MSALLDTNIAIHLRERNDAILMRFNQLLTIPSISVATQVELEGGIYADPDVTDRRREAVDKLLEVLPVIPFDEEMARAYGKIIAAVGFNRRKVIDRMIAATALVRGVTLITANGADFADIDDLKLEIWAA